MEIIKKIEAFVKACWQWLTSRSATSYLHFIAGTLISAFMAIVLQASALAPTFAALFIAFIKEFIKEFRGGNFSLPNFLTTTIAALIINAMCWV